MLSLLWYKMHTHQSCFLHIRHQSTTAPCLTALLNLSIFMVQSKEDNGPNASVNPRFLNAPNRRNPQPRVACDIHFHEKSECHKPYTNMKSWENSTTVKASRPRRYRGPAFGTEIRALGAMRAAGNCKRPSPGVLSVRASRAQTSRYTLDQRSRDALFLVLRVLLLLLPLHLPSSSPMGSVLRNPPMNLDWSSLMPVGTATRPNVSGKQR